MSHCLFVIRVNATELRAILSKSAQALETAITGAGEEMVGYVDLDRSWHAIHYVLTGSADGGPEPHCFLHRGGVSLDYESAFVRALSVEATQAFHEALDGVDDEEFANRFDVAQLHEAGICPQDWDETDADTALVSVLTYYIFLRNFVKAAAADGCGLVIHLEP